MNPSFFNATLSRCKPAAHALALASKPTVAALTWLISPFLLLTRVYVAKVFFLSGLTKLADWDVTVMLFTEEHPVPFLPPTVAALLGTGAELALPVLLVLGVCGRFAALGLLLVNAVAVISLQTIAVAAMQQHVFWGWMLACLAIVGVGRWSLDHYLNEALKP